MFLYGNKKLRLRLWLNKSIFNNYIFKGRDIENLTIYKREIYKENELLWQIKVIKKF